MTKKTEEKKYWTVAEAAELVNYSVHSLYKYIDRGILPECSKIGSIKVWNKKDMETVKGIMGNRPPTGRKPVEKGGE